jgi:hypothetical protein
MNDLQTTLLNELYKVRKSTLDLKFPITNKRLEEIIHELLVKHNLKCKIKPRVRFNKNNTDSESKYANTIIEMVVSYKNETEGYESPPIKIVLFLDTYLNYNDMPEYGITGEYKNTFKEAVYRPSTIQDEGDVKGYVSKILNDISHSAA